MASNRNRKREKIETGAIGESGTQINYGIITGEEYNFDLQGRRKFIKYNEMRLGSASVSTSLEAVKLPIIQAKYTVEPASDDATDVRIAEELEYNLFTHLDWKQTTREAMTYLDFGFVAMEEVLEPGEINGRPMIILDRLELRKQSSIESWQLADGSLGIRQRTSSGIVKDIRMSKLLHIAHKMEGQNYEGVSVLRTAYAHWKYVNTFYKIDAIGYERQALGVLDITYEPGADPKQIAILEEAARQMRANPQSFISRPRGFDIEWMDMKAGTLKDPTKAIEHHDRQISKNLLEQFNEIGSGGSSGAYSSSQTQYELFILAVQAIADAFVSAVNRQIVKRWVDANYNVTDYPKVTVSKIGDDNMGAVVTAITQLVSAGIITPTDEDEAYFRRKFELPDLPKELKRDAGNDKTTDSANDKTKVDDVNEDAEAGGNGGDAKKKVEASQVLATARQLSQALTENLYGTTGYDTSRAA